MDNKQYDHLYVSHDGFTFNKVVGSITYEKKKFQEIPIGSRDNAYEGSFCLARDVRGRLNMKINGRLHLFTSTQGRAQGPINR